MEINLYGDWIASLRDELTNYGYDISSSDDKNVTHIYLNLLKRLVAPMPRVIKKSNGFVCPNELSEGLIQVERKIKLGEDLSPNLSRLLRRSNFNDPLLNHWGIHHIHLGSTIDADGFVARTGPVLFARFDNENAYFIDILPHGSWALQNLVSILHNNWPDSIQQFLLKGIVGLARPVTDADVSNLRKANINTMVELEENVVYAPMGGGFSTSGISVDVVRQSDRCKDRLESMQKHLIENIERIKKNAEASGLSLPDDPKFGLEMRDNIVYAVEINIMLGVKLGEL